MTPDVHSPGTGMVARGPNRARFGAHLARYTVPREVVVVDDLPCNATGKVLKRELER